MEYVNALREKIARGQLNFGTHCSCTDLSFYELCGKMDYDFVWIDAEHGAMSNPMIINAILAVNAGGKAAIVRVIDHSVGNIKPVLEYGPDGIIFPLVNTAEDARRCVEVCKYPPEGIRGYGPRRSQWYGAMSDAEYFEQANDSIMLLMQCERKEGVDNLDEILAVPGVDGIICGLNDLSASIGKFGQAYDPEMIDLMEKIISKCREAGKAYGASIGVDYKMAEFWMERGASFLSMGFPQDYFMAMGNEVIGNVREIESRVLKQ